MIYYPISRGARGQKKTMRNEETWRKWRFCEVEHKHLTPVAVLAMHAIMGLNNLCKPIETYTYLQIIPQQNTANLQLQTYENNQWTFLLFNTGVDFSSHFS